jgi:hypothetical protein
MLLRRLIQTLLTCRAQAIFWKNIHVEQQSLHTSSFKFVFRKANSAAHYLAKEAASIMSYVCLLEDTPTSISSIVIRETVSPYIIF